MFLNGHKVLRGVPCCKETNKNAPESNRGIEEGHTLSESDQNGRSSESSGPLAEPTLAAEAAAA